MPECQHVSDPEPRWGPLLEVAELVAETDWPTVDPHDFMYMGREVGDDGTDIHLYKAIDTRRYLNLDAGGRAYWYCGTVEDLSVDWFTPSIYEPAPSLEAAVRHVRS